MVDKNSAPAFKMGTAQRSDTTKNNGFPGPGTYESVNHLKAAISASKVAQGKRFQDYDTFTPGPGTYGHQNNSHVQTAKIVSRYHEKTQQKSPGPGEYDPDYKKTIKANKGYSLGKGEKLPDENKPFKDTPGPFAYEAPKATILGVNPTPKFDPADRKLKLSIQPADTPGPAAYSTVRKNGNIKNQPQISFSKSSRSKSMRTFVPAPNVYTLKSDIQMSKQKKKGFSLSFRTQQKTEESLGREIPGPGTYNSTTLDKLKKSAPLFSMGKYPKLKLENERQIRKLPGPDAYDFHSKTFEHKSFSIGKDVRKGFENKNKFPGPGSYDSKIAKDQPSFSVSKSRRKSLANEDKSKPGPGHYEPKLCYTSQYQNIKIGTDERRTFKGNKNFPGPGAYDVEDKKPTGGWSMGHESRLPKDRTTRNIVPGPGNYKIPSVISNLPQYAAIKLK